MSPLRVVRAEGDGIARGTQIGVELRDLIQASVGFYHRYLDRRGVSSEQLQDLLTPYLVAAETAYPDMMSVLKGMAVGALVPVLALCVLLAFVRSGYNYAEQLAFTYFVTAYGLRGLPMTSSTLGSRGWSP